MRLHDNLARPALVHAADLSWIASPSAGVDRRMLYRDGGEVARATTIVRYAAGTTFPSHVHPGGEAYYVLDGVFQDEDGDHPAGSYVRNPPGTRHAPRCADGCTILVWLYQFDQADAEPVNVRVDGITWDSQAPGHRRRTLHRSHEWVAIDSMEAGACVAEDLRHGGELFVIRGAVQVGPDQLNSWSWLRLPAGAVLSATALADGAEFLLRRPLAPLTLVPLVTTS